MAGPRHGATGAGARRIAELIFRRAVAPLPVRVVLPDGRVLGSGGKDAPVMNLVRPGAFFSRLGADAKIGFGEAYMTGDWTTGPGTDLADLLAPFAGRMASLVHPLLQRLRHVVERTQPAHEENSRQNSRTNISRHYDLSNELFEQFLDETMTYSSAWFEPGDTLADAQLRKMDGVLDLARVRSGMHVLEIGSGWGGLAIRAARERGAHVTTLTLSTEQQTLARQRAEAAGVGHLVDVRLQDYRDATGQFDAIVSVEMIEAVGEAYWPTYFAALDTLLAPGGRVGLQAITIAHDRLMATRRSYTWIHKYVFPGGIIPSIRSISDNLAAHTGCRSSSAATSARTTPAPSRCGGSSSWATGVAVGVLRRHLPADVGVLPRLLRGGLPGRVPGREPARAGPAPVRGLLTWSSPARGSG